MYLIKLNILSLKRKFIKIYIYFKTSFMNSKHFIICFSINIVLKIYKMKKNNKNMIKVIALLPLFHFLELYIKWILLQFIKF